MKKLKSFFTKNVMLTVFSAVLLATFGIFLVGCGEKGEDGSKWITGTDMPTTEVGVNGDMYLDTDDYVLYQKANNQWQVVMNNFGKGEVVEGNKWFTGTNTPAVELGANGDMYIDTDDYILYQKTDGQWIVAISDFGKGEEAEATKWITGTLSPATDLGSDGDMYLDTDDYILYQKENGVWKTVIEDFGKGEIGANGQDGKDGAKWLTGEDAPTEDLGVNGDLYIDTKNYVLYQKSDNIWSILIVDFGKGFDDTAFQNKISELEEKINSGKIDVERLSSYQNEVIYDKTNLISEEFTWEDNSYINYRNGVLLSPNEIYISSGTYIPVEPEKNYVFFCNKTVIYFYHYAFYDEGFGYISGSNEMTNILKTPENAAYVRFSIHKTGSKVTFEEFIVSELEFYNQNSTIYSVPQQIAVIQGINANDTLIDGSISVEKCEFFDKYSSPNLIQPGKVYDGYIMGTTSPNLATNATYTVMTEIPVVEGQILNVWQGSFSKVSMRFVTQFDENFNLISRPATNNENVNITDFTVPIGTKYVAITIYSSAWNGTEKVQVQCSIDGLYLGKYYEPGVPIYKLNGNYYDMVAEQAPLHVYLPDEICVAEGMTIELYNSQICLEYEDYNFQWLASGFGRPYERKFSITGTKNLTGQTKVLTLNLFDDNLNIKYTASCTVKFVSNVIDTEQLIIPIGDSLTNNKAWLTKVNEYSNGKIKFRGTQGTMDKTDTKTMSHEGRSGATTGWYNSGTSKYDFNPTNSTLEVKEDENGQYTENPFWNPTTDAFDFDYYCNSKQDGGAGYFQDENAQEISINPTGVQIYLGTNGISLDSTSSVNNIKTLIDNIRKSSKGATIPIYVVNTLFRPNQIFSTNNDGYTTNDSGEFGFRANMKVMNLEIGLYQALNDYKNVFFVPVAATHDSEYNYPYEEVSVNPHSTEKFKQYTDCVHPTTAGYYQMADIMFSTIAAHYKDNI